jgi:hypothetical protein
MLTGKASRIACSMAICAVCGHAFDATELPGHPCKPDKPCVRLYLQPLFSDLNEPQRQRAPEPWPQSPAATTTTSDGSLTYWVPFGRI